MTDTTSEQFTIDRDDPEFVRNMDAERPYQDAEGEVIGGDTLIVHHLTRHPGMCIVTKQTEDSRGFVDTQTRFVGAPNPNIFLSVSYIMSLASKIAGVPSKTEYQKMLTELAELREYKARVEPLVLAVEGHQAPEPTPAAKKTAAKK